MCECLAADCEERHGSSTTTQASVAPTTPTCAHTKPPSAADASASKPSVQCTLQHFHDLSCLPCLKKAPSGDLRHYYGDLREVLLSRPARDELVNDDRGPMVHTCEQRRVLHVELALLLCRCFSWWRMGSTR